MSQNNTVQTPENENRLVPTVVSFVIMMVLFLASIYVLGFLTLDTIWPMGASLVLVFLAFWIPQTIMGRSDSAGEH
ncbi:hypothetical protein V1639_01715 [Pseudarthrobacter sp. J75]|uniref:hypothetical protein n=1 Tax=unclassified Pseudarthrobacter TaxID=2647000 RepID=UPI002E8136D4|nr:MULTISPECIES: hypothetical protein [unclassified Pseudarthrobacter]MEE2521669.1 hypothetical protein [Pseudarthrobacter sp. J47]MEE2527746.1 hypothetical protein [Pseudarthrobacter sp. J75]MEE2569314.1 hypothetical protein [Pseudarthrobacter sp. J64]